MAEETAKVGRPLKFKSAKELQKKIDEYYESCMDERWNIDSGEWKAVYDRKGNIIKDQIKPFTISGLAVHLETSRQTLLNYEDNEEFFDTITRAKAKIENYAEEQLFDKNARNIAGIQFNLTNNYKRWANKQELEHSGDMSLVVNRRRMNSDASVED